MKTIFELIKIYTNSKAHYPLRKTQMRNLGLFPTLAKAKAQMLKEVKYCQEGEYERKRIIAENEGYCKDEKQFGHDVVLAYKIIRRELDVPEWESIQSVRTYTSDGQLNDECLLDEAGKRHFKGRKPEQIRFKPGDIVEVVDEMTAELCIVGHTQPTTADYEKYSKRSFDDYVNDLRKPSGHGEFMQNKMTEYWDSSYDCYVMFYLGTGVTYFHPASPTVFRPTKLVPKALQAKLRSKYEEMMRC